MKRIETRIKELVKDMKKRTKKHKKSMKEVNSVLKQSTYKGRIDLLQILLEKMEQHIIKIKNKHELVKEIKTYNRDIENISNNKLTTIKNNRCDCETSFYLRGEIFEAENFICNTKNILRDYPHLLEEC